MTLVVKEGEVTWLDNLTIEDIPDGIPSQIRIHTKQGRLGIESQGLVGSLLLNNGQTLTIMSKVGEANFYRMLLRAEGSLDLAKREMDRIVEYCVGSSQTISDVVGPIFLDSIEHILSRGLSSERAREVATGASVQGRLLPLQTFVRLQSRKTDPVVSIRHNRLYNTPENRLLLSALIHLQSSVSPHLSKRCQLVASRLSSFVSFEGSIQEDLLYVDRLFASRGYGGPRDYYRSSLMMAKIILGSAGLSVSGNSTVSGQSMLINAPLIFEKFLKETIASFYSSRGFIVQDGSRCGKYLYSGGSFELKPDILAFYSGRLVLLADAKYKQPTQSDHYQMMAYLKAFGISTGLLIKPSEKNSECEVITYTSLEGERVYELGIPLAEPEIVDTVLSQVIEKFGVSRT
jgi:5-methylcytosine-specific restriction endonuclease McrBC regulatory subunit McrC